MWKRLVFTGFALGASLAAARAADAQERAQNRVRLTYHGPKAGCPREDEAFIALSAALPPASDERALPADVRVDIDSADGRYVGKLSLDGAERSSSRELESPSCADLIKAMSFVLGVAYRETTAPAPRAAVSAEAPEPAPSVQPSAASTSPRPPRERPREAPPSSSPSHAEVGVGAGVSALWGTGPTAAPRYEGHLELGLARDSLLSPSIRAGAAYASSGMQVDAGRAEFSVLTAAAAICPIRVGGREGKMQLSPCARAEIGDLHGEGSGIPSARDEHTLWSAAGAELAARWMLSSGIGLELTTALLVPFRRQAYVIEPARRIHETGVVAFSAGAGVFFSAL